MSYYNKLLLITVNIILALVIFYFAQPIHNIPSDDVVFAKDINKVSECLKEKRTVLCWPKPNRFYTKPILTYIGGYLHWILNSYYFISAISVLALLNIISIALISTIFQMVVASIAENKFIAVVITGTLIYSSPTVLGCAFWWGYAAILTLFIYSSWVILWKMALIYTSIVHGTPFLAKNSVTLFFNCILLIFLLTLAFYTHLSSIPFLLSGLLCSFLFIPGLLGVPIVNNRLSYLINLFRPRVILFLLLLVANLLATIIVIERIDDISMAINDHSYLQTYRDNINLNKEAEKNNNVESALMPVMYYLTARWPILILIVFLVLTIKITGFSIFSKTNESRRLRFMLCAAFIGLFGIILSGSTKQLRITFPANMAVLLACSFLLVVFVENFILNKKLKSYRILNVITIVVLINYYYTSFVMSKSIWLSSFGFEHILDKINSKNRSVNTRNNLFLEKNKFWDKYLNTVALTPVFTRYTYVWLKNRMRGDLKNYDNVFILMTPQSNNHIVTSFVGDHGDEEILSNTLEDNLNKIFKKNDYILVSSDKFLDKEKDVTIINLPLCRRPPIYNFMNEVIMKQYVDEFLRSPIQGMLDLYTLCSNNSDKTKWYLQKK